MKKSELLATLSYVAPALSNRDFVPILCCLCFEKKKVFAYNDMIGIESPIDLDIDAAIRGALALQVLGTFDDLEVSVSQKSRGGGVTFVCGKSKFNAESEPMDSIIFRMPKERPPVKISLDPDLMRMMSHCNISASEDTSSPEYMGVKLSIGKTSHAYSTDTASITHALHQYDKAPSRRTINLRLSAECITAMQSLFDQTVKIEEDEDVQTMLPQMYIGDDHIIVEYPNGVKFYSKAILGEAANIEGEIDKHTANVDDKLYQPTPDGMRGALDRLSFIYDTTARKQDVLIHVKGKGMRLECSGVGGGVKEEIALEKEYPSAAYRANPVIMRRVLDVSNQFCLTDTCFIYRGDGFLHLVAVKKE